MINEQQKLVFAGSLFAFIMVIALGLLVVLATVVNLAFAWFGSIIKNKYGGAISSPYSILVALFGLIILANAFMYKVLPDVKLTWREMSGLDRSVRGFDGLGGLVIGCISNWAESVQHSRQPARLRW